MYEINHFLFCWKMLVHTIKKEAMWVAIMLWWKGSMMVAILSHQVEENERKRFAIYLCYLPSCFVDSCHLVMLVAATSSASWLPCRLYKKDWMYEMNTFLCCWKMLLPCRQQLQMPWIKQKSLSHVKDSHKKWNKGLPCTILYGCHARSCTVHTYQQLRCWFSKNIELW